MTDRSSVQPAAVGSEYVSIAELAKRIPYAPQTIRNLMTQGVFIRDVHYLKPRGRVIFKWTAVREWLEGRQLRP
jgi:hypothetical protein